MLSQLICSDAPEQALRYHGFACIAGVDEVGRGALFGPVVAAAVVLPLRTTRLQKLGLRDSKQLTREERESLDREIRKCAVAVGIGEVDSETIDRINIYQASRLAMCLAVDSLPCTPDHLLIDAMRLDHACAQTKLIYGDSLSVSIAAASVIAKVHRDAQLRAWDQEHPQYGLASHKGYATPEHRRALEQHGPTPLHRRSFAPVAKCYGDEAFEHSLLTTDLLFDETELQEEMEPCPND
ncbi:MAG: ribonuclease HII [Janthinobacterium lividum]